MSPTGEICGHSSTRENVDVINHENSYKTINFLIFDRIAVSFLSFILRGVSNLRKLPFVPPPIVGRHYLHSYEIFSDTSPALWGSCLKCGNSIITIIAKQRLTPDFGIISNNTPRGRLTLNIAIQHH